MEFSDYIKSPMCRKVKLRRALCPPVEGTLCVTGHHFIFSSSVADQDELWVLHCMIDSVERRLNGMMGGSIIVKCKDFRVLQLDIRSIEEFNNVAYSLDVLSHNEDLRAAYPLFYRAASIDEKAMSQLNMQQEFDRLALHQYGWRLSHANRHFSLCDSYPETVVVPASVTDAQLCQAAVFRQGGRFPVLSYRHEKGSVLLRSSQPLIGSRRRCREDESLLSAALSASLPPSTHPQQHQQAGRKGYIIDTRTHNLAMSAKSRGGGCESESQYPHWKRVHKPIDRHATQLESLHILMTAVNDSSPANSLSSSSSSSGTMSGAGRMSVSQWMQQLVSSNWLSHVKDTLNCACLAAQCLDQEQACVLVHGADGLDSTLQVSSLAQLLLDPHCRTLAGFVSLIEREWLLAGHPFSTRHRHSLYTPAPTRDRAHGAAPSFLLFLDCVWQVAVSQFGTTCQFNETLLLELFEHAYGSQFGTFLCDSVCERSRVQLYGRCRCLWSFLMHESRVQRYLNPLYEADERVLWPSVAPMSVRLWTGMYLRWNCRLSPSHRALQRVHEVVAENKRLQNEACSLRQRITELQQEAMRRDLLASTSHLTSPLSPSSTNQAHSHPLSPSSNNQAHSHPLSVHMAACTVSQTLSADTPALQDGTPALQDGTPAVQDGTPAVQDGTPAVQDGTPALQDGTA